METPGSKNQGPQAKSAPADTPRPTFEMFHHHEQRPVTDAILEAYGQAGIPQDRQEERQD